MVFDPALRDDGVYGVAVLWSFVIGAVLAPLRAGAVATVAVTIAVVGGPAWAWWAVPAVCLTAAPALAWLHTREDILDNLARGKFPPAAVIARHLLNVARRPSASLDGVLEAVTPLLLAFGVGSRIGPLAGSPDGYLVGACMAIIYSLASTAQLLVDSSIYLPEGSYAVGMIRLGRLGVPAVLAVVYSLLLSPNAYGPVAVVPGLAAAACLGLYLVPLFYEKLLKASRLQARRDIDGALSVAASTIHSYFSPPLFFLSVAARTGSAERLTGTIGDLRAMVHDCMNEVMGAVPDGSFGSLVAGFRRLLPADVASQMRCDPGSEALPLQGPDLAVARRVLADLCSNALKAGWPGNMETKVDLQAVLEADAATGRWRYRVTVQDDGPGFERGRNPGGSLALLEHTLHLVYGGLQFSKKSTGGTIVTAVWMPLGEEQPNEDTDRRR